MSNESLSKGELIEKLGKISKLCDNVLEIKAEIDEFVPEDNYKRKIEVPRFPFEVNNEYDKEVLDILENDLDHTDDNAIEAISSCFDKAYHPEKPADFKKPVYSGADTGKSKEKQHKLRLISNIGLGVAIFFLLGALVGTSDTPEALPTILIIAVLGTVAFVGGRALEKKEKEVEDKLEAEAKSAYDIKVNKLNEQYNNTIKIYEDECNAYMPVRQAFLKKYTDWREIYLDSLAEEEKISEQLEADRQAAVDKIRNEKLVPAINALEETNDILSKDYLGAIDLIIELLENNRADNLKEAINVYEEIVYRERQLQLQREQEEQRRREEEQRRQDEERRHREDMAQREAQERQRRYEEEQRQRDEERRHREDMAQREREARNREYQEKERIRRENLKAAEERRDQENKQRSAAQAQCRACVHAGSCNMMVHNKTPNCTGFTPRH